MNADNVAERIVKHQVNRLILYYQKEFERLARRESEVSASKTVLHVHQNCPEARLLLETINEELESIKIRREFIRTKLVFLRNLHLLQSRKGEPYGDDHRTQQDDVGAAWLTAKAPKRGSGLNPGKGDV